MIREPLKFSRAIILSKETHQFLRVWFSVRQHFSAGKIGRNNDGWPLRVACKRDICKLKVVYYPRKVQQKQHVFCMCKNNNILFTCLIRLSRRFPTFQLSKHEFSNTIRCIGHFLFLGVRLQERRLASEIDWRNQTYSRLTYSINNHAPAKAWRRPFG